MRDPQALWLLPLWFGLWSGACASELTDVPETMRPPGTGGAGSLTGGTGGASSTTGGASSTTGGTGSSTGGTSASSGGTTSVVCGQAKGAAADLAIDDLEDGDNTIGNGMSDPDPPVRVGYWFTYNEKTNDQTSSCVQMPPPDPMGLLPFPPAPSPGNGSRMGAHTSGTSCTKVWGAGIGFDFNNCNMKSNAYDASAYRGIQFWYKSTQPIRALVTSTPNTTAGGCVSDCDNHHGKNFAASTAGTTGTILWSELSGTAQIGTPPMDPQSYGMKRPFDATKLLGFQVQVDQAGGASFDIWLDDVTFL
jgi:hypothetical protein